MWCCWQASHHRLEGCDIIQRDRYFLQRPIILVLSRSLLSSSISYGIGLMSRTCRPRWHQASKAQLSFIEFWTCKLQYQDSSLEMSTWRPHPDETGFPVLHQSSGPPFRPPLYQASPLYCWHFLRQFPIYKTTQFCSESIHPSHINSRYSNS